MSAPPAADAARPRLSTFDAVMIVMGGIIGIGIFFNPSGVARLVAEPWAFLLMWALAGLLALFGAFTFAELGATFPHAGGWFVYLREMWGELAAFLFAWIVLFVVTSGANAAVARFAAENLSGLWGLPVLEGATLTAVAAGILVALTLLVLGGIKLGATFQNACMLLKLGALGVLIVAGLFLVAPAGPTDAAAAVEPLARPPLWKGMILATLPVLFSYGGWQMLGYTATEVRDPERTLPRAIVLGVCGVVAVYLLVNLAFLRVVGIEGMAASSTFAREVATRTLGPVGGDFLSAAMAVSALGICAVFTIATPWVYVAMARERLFFASFARLHPRTGAPVLGLVALCAVSLGYLVLVSGETIDGLVGAVVFAEWIFHALVAIGLVRLRRRRPDLPQPFRSFAYPLMPLGYFVLASVVVLGNLKENDLATTGTGLVVLAAGAVAYALWKKWSGPGASSAAVED